METHRVQKTSPTTQPICEGSRNEPSSLGHRP
jgi:hypothetical protein